MHYSEKTLKILQNMENEIKELKEQFEILADKIYDVRTAILCAALLIVIAHALLTLVIIFKFRI